MTLTGRLVDPPPGARKVPGHKLWLTRDGTPYGPYGMKSPGDGRSPTVNTVDDRGRERKMSLAQVMAMTWLPPKPPGSKLAHLDGNPANNRASNLAWVPKLTNREKREAWKGRALPKMLADRSDPRHGTRTGYAIGCRCTECRNAARVYEMTLATRKTIRELEDLCRRRAR